MPGRDGTGPFGMGPRTGRSAGLCMGLGGHFRRSMSGLGRGRRNRLFSSDVSGKPRTGSSFSERIEFLKNQASFHQQSLATINKRIEELEAAQAK